MRTIISDSSHLFFTQSSVCDGPLCAVMSVFYHNGGEAAKPVNTSFFSRRHRRVKRGGGKADLRFQQFRRYLAVAIRSIRLFTQSIAMATSGRTGNSPRASRYIPAQSSLHVILGGHECLLRYAKVRSQIRLTFAKSSLLSFAIICRSTRSLALSPPGSVTA